jgi:hypothetical protein
VAEEAYLMLLGLPGVRRASDYSGLGLSSDQSIFDILCLGIRKSGWGPILMEILLALIIGLAVAGVVFVLGKSLIASKSSSDPVPATARISDFRHRHA